MKKLHIALLFGGQSEEHEVSINSAKNIFNALDKNKYTVDVIGITKSGQWQLLTPALLYKPSNDVKNALAKKTYPLKNTPLEENALTVLHGVDVVFPVLHGPNGEDGTVQGLLRILNLPFVGAGVLGSAVGMDKDVAKRLLREAGIPVAKFRVVREHERVSYDEVTHELGNELFVKPANLGSSVGVSKVRNTDEFVNAVAKAFGFDKKILIEEAITGRELECAVLGNENPKASVIGEIIPQGHEFYDYEAKYIDTDGASLIIPAATSPAVKKKIQELAIQTFKTLCCEGMARVDVFLKSNGDVLVNEINTIPGFTNISMYPALWQESGIGYSELIDRLIDLALKTHKRDRKL
jgi:D-alanine-D-alanine ligase